MVSADEIVLANSSSVLVASVVAATGRSVTALSMAMCGFLMRAANIACWHLLRTCRTFPRVVTGFKDRIVLAVQSCCSMRALGVADEMSSARE